MQDDYRRMNALAYRHKIRMSKPRTALPPLYGKEVEVISITKQVTQGGFSREPGDTRSRSLYHVHLRIDGLEYRVPMLTKDEMECMVRITRMQARKPRSPFHGDE